MGDIARENNGGGMVAAALENFGTLDIAVNNAGIASTLARLAETGADEAERVIAINVLGVIHAMRHELSAMSEAFVRTGQRAAIVNMASVAGLVGASHLAVYAASKTCRRRADALDCSGICPQGIRINAVCPSFARTPMLGQITPGRITRVSISWLKAYPCAVWPIRPKCPSRCALRPIRQQLYDRAGAGESTAV